MKILRLQFEHYTQVVFPMLAVKYHWFAYTENKIRSLIFKFLGIPFTSILNRSHISVKQMKKLVSFCQLISSFPQKFNSIFTDLASLPFSSLEGVLTNG